MTISFKLPDVQQQLLHDAESTGGAAGASAVAYAVPNAIARDKRFTQMGGGCPVSCRSSIVRVR